MDDAGFVFETIDDSEWWFCPDVGDNLERAEDFKEYIVGDGGPQPPMGPDLFSQYPRPERLPLVCRIKPQKQREFLEDSVARLNKKGKVRPRDVARVAVATQHAVIEKYVTQIYNLKLRTGTTDRNVQTGKELVAALELMPAGMAQALTTELVGAVQEVNSESPGFLLDARWQGSF